MKTLNKPLQHGFYLTSEILIFTALAFFSQAATATTSFSRINLVTDDQTINAAKINDPNLINAWGISYSSTGPFWVSDNGKGVSTLYTVNPVTNATLQSPLIVTIPGNGSVTGQVFNPSTDPKVFNGNRFIFVSEDGTVSGWRGALGTTAETLNAGSPTNIYKGVAEATVSGNSYIYAANFGTGGIDVNKGTTTAPDLSGNFTDPNLPTDYAPFNIQNLGDKLYVTYALHTLGSGDEKPGPGLGYVDVFSTQGDLLGRIGSGGTLNAPWGLAIAPTSLGEFAGDLLVGNFGDGKINAFNLAKNTFDGQLTGTDGKPLSIDGLWALTIGNDGSAGSSKALYFSAGPNNEAHGLFGTVAAIPVPAAVWLFGSALVGFRVFGKRQIGQPKN
jgi:uncharacterized protein (TIGR03118 family)